MAGGLYRCQRGAPLRLWARTPAYVPSLWPGIKALFYLYDSSGLQRQRSQGKQVEACHLL